MNSVSNFIVLRRICLGRIEDPLAHNGVCSTVRVKSILGIGPKVKESIEDPFK
jgi:hypothetical protein